MITFEASNYPYLIYQRLTFDLSVKVVHNGIANILNSATRRSIVVEFIMEHPLDETVFNPLPHMLYLEHCIIFYR